ncbi:alpha/beta hydrolase domain-containing protein [uncultured Aurantimicrobium sp.]|uniref:alpha/beta hydrolase domain-containing protein n=1 Tax=uncultured Aurantimicrobium sp. TaxID=1705357 RepID=UPI00262EA7F9|nr:alpha/beta hydrolase domain-containing protein [uncultured Aurantimicrobium sp.]
MKFTTPRRGGRIGAVAFASLLIAGTTLSLAGCTTASTNSDATKIEYSVPPAVLTPVEVAGTTPMAAASIDLGEYGYTETEYYADGKANRYRGASNMDSTTAEVIDSNHDYRTRVLVRTPEAGKFNGTLLVEWTNVTIGVDADFVFAEAHEEYLREGYAYAVVSAQNAGIDALKSWSPKRYGSLHAASINADPTTGEAIDACPTPAPCPGDAYSWDIFSGVTEALLDTNSPDAALSGFDVANVIAVGQSQSASRLTGYYNTIQPIDNLFDGFVLWDRATNALRDDVQAPAISINSESLTPLFPVFPNGDNTRTWEIAGATHGSKYAAAYVDGMFTRDNGLKGPDGTPISFTEWVAPTCASEPIFSTVENGLVIADATDAIVKWIETGVPAPDTILFERDADGNLVRDEQGNVKGGIQLADFLVPTAALNAFNGTNFPCAVSGSRTEFTSSELANLYGSSSDYVAQVTSVTQAVEKAGYILPVDAESVISAAKKVKISK